MKLQTLKHKAAAALLEHQDYSVHSELSDNPHQSFSAQGKPEILNTGAPALLLAMTHRTIQAFLNLELMQVPWRVLASINWQMASFYTP